MITRLKGNGRQFDVENVKKNPESELKGKKIIFLGSSVTRGAGACGISFVEFLEARDGILPVKEAVDGTTLVTENADSYIPRMKKIDKEITADAFICQLSTNDAATGKKMGNISGSRDMECFDTNTIAGAIEHIISYAKKTWGCPVIFYTGTRFSSDTYGEMVELLLAIKEKWHCGVIDMWNDKKMNNITKKQRELYMPIDGIHPSKAGYLEWWLPKMEEDMIKWIS